jgi:hypothetical protein
MVLKALRLALESEGIGVLAISAGNSRYATRLAGNYLTGRISGFRLNHP